MTKTGSILIPLLVLLTLSFGVFMVSKYFSTSQANVETAVGSRYQLSPSQHMDQSDEWIKEEHKQYHFSFYYPKQWVASQSAKTTGNELYSIQKALSNKISLKITVFKTLEIKEGTKKAKFDKNQFFLVEDASTKKIAVMETPNYYYQIELSQSNYFPEELEFTGTYYLLLKKFQVSGN